MGCSYLECFFFVYARSSYNCKIRVSNDESRILIPKGAFLGHSVPWPLLRLPFYVTGVPVSHFYMLIEFLGTQNLYVDTKIMILARILGILCFGGHLVRHFVNM